MVTISRTNQLDRTLRIYDQFYNSDLTVNASDYDVVLSYFRGTSTSETIAQNFTAILFRIAQEGNYKVVDLLQILKGAPNKLQMNAIVCYYLNTLKSKVSLYGTGIIPKPNEAIQRNIVL